MNSQIKLSRILIYVVLILFAFYYLLPLYVMLVNSLKPLDEIRGGGMLYLPSVWTLDPWRSAWSSAQIGVDPSGLKPYFWNSIAMVVPAVLLSTIFGSLNGYVLTKWQFKGHGDCIWIVAIVLLYSISNCINSDGKIIRCFWFGGNHIWFSFSAFSLRYWVHYIVF